MAGFNGPGSANLSEKEPIAQGSSAHVLVGDEKIEVGSSSSSSSHHPNSITKLDSHIVNINQNAKAEDDPLAHLPPNEQEIIRRQLEIPEVKLNYFTLFRYATKNDLILIFTAALASIIAGAVMPLMTIVFGQLAGVFQKFMLSETSPQSMQSELNKFTV